MNSDLTAPDRGEPVSLIEPLLIGDRYRHRGLITDLAFGLSQKSAGFRRSMPERPLTSKRLIFLWGAISSVTLCGRSWLTIGTVRQQWGMAMYGRWGVAGRSVFEKE
jgi:hypothetical protein